MHVVGYCATFPHLCATSDAQRELPEFPTSLLILSFWKHQAVVFPFSSDIHYFIWSGSYYTDSFRFQVSHRALSSKQLWSLCFAMPVIPSALCVSTSTDCPLFNSLWLSHLEHDICPLEPYVLRGNLAKRKRKTHMYLSTLTPHILLMERETYLDIGKVS